MFVYLVIFMHDDSKHKAEKRGLLCVCVSGATAGGPQPGHGDIMREGLNWPIIKKDG